MLFNMAFFVLYNCDMLCKKGLSLLRSSQSQSNQRNPKIN
jgi:hypothetical protein